MVLRRLKIRICTRIQAKRCITKDPLVIWRTGEELYELKWGTFQKALRVHHFQDKLSGLTTFQMAGRETKRRRKARTWRVRASCMPVTPYVELLCNMLWGLSAVYRSWPRKYEKVEAFCQLWRNSWYKSMLNFSKVDKLVPISHSFVADFSAERSTWSYSATYFRVEDWDG